MIEFSELIHYSTIASIVGINALGVGIGQGLTGSKALDAINRQPNARQDIVKTAILGIALIETAAVMGGFMAIMLLLGTKQTITQSSYAYLTELGIAFAICLSGFVLGIVSSFPASAACISVARQPFFSQKIVRFMLVTQTLIQTPIIFGLIIALFIKESAATAYTLRESLRLIASGLCIGLGSVGPAIGLALFSKAACESIGINRNAYNKIVSFTFMSQAIIETPIIFSVLISIALLFIVPRIPQENVLDGIIMLAAGLAMGLGTLGPGISSGKTAAQACHQIALKPDLYSTLSRISMLAQGLIEACAIYSILVAFGLIFFR